MDVEAYVAKGSVGRALEDPSAPRRVLVAGGTTGSLLTQTFTPLSNVRIFDPVTGESTDADVSFMKELEAVMDPKATDSFRADVLARITRTRSATERPWRAVAPCLEVEDWELPREGERR